MQFHAVRNLGLCAVIFSILLSTSEAVAERFGIHFVASAHSLHTDNLQNNNFLSSASRVRWDVYMPADINDNGFVTINGPRVRRSSRSESSAADASAISSENRRSFPLIFHEVSRKPSPSGTVGLKRRIVRYDLRQSSRLTMF